MKKIISTIVLSAFFLTSCEKMSLDLAPEDYFASGSFWKNESHDGNPCDGGFIAADSHDEITR